MGFGYRDPLPENVAPKCPISRRGIGECAGCNGMRRSTKTELADFRSLQGARGQLARRPDRGTDACGDRRPEQMATAQLGGFQPYLGFFVFVAGSLGFALLGANRFLSAGANSTITPIFAGSLALIAAVGHAALHGSFGAAGRCGRRVLMLGAGIFRAGWVANLLSIPVLTGFLAGIAVHIAISQAPSFLGLPGGSGTFFDRLKQIAQAPRRHPAGCPGHQD